MLIVSLLSHSWSPQSSIVFRDLAKHWTREEEELWISLNKSNIFLGLFHEYIMILNSFCD